MERQYPLHTFVNRILLKRLILVSVGICLLIGGITWIQTRNLAKDRAVYVALDRLAVIRAQFVMFRERGVPLEKAVSDAVNTVGSMDFDHSRGKFIYGVFYDKDGDFFEFKDERFQEIKQVEVSILQ